MEEMKIPFIFHSPFFVPDGVLLLTLEMIVTSSDSKFFVKKSP